MMNAFGQDNKKERERKVKESLFGAVRKARATGGHQVKREKLLEPLEGPSSVIHGFCEGCGWTLEYTRSGVEMLVKRAGIEPPASLEGMFIKTKSCSLCDGKDEEISFEFI